MDPPPRAGRPRHRRACVLRSMVVASDLASGAVQLATIALSGAPVDIAAGGDAVWVAVEDHAVLRIDPSTDQVVATIAVPDRPRTVVFAAGSVWVASRWAGSVTRIDPATNAVVESRTVPGADRLAATSDALWVVTALSCGL